MSSSPDETAPLFDISGLHYRYAGAQVDALADLELEVHAGEFVAVVGANGSGKSTLARLIGGLEKPAAARRALACGHDLLVEGGRMAARRDVGVLFQNPENQLVAQCVEDDVAFGLENLAWPAADVRGRVDEMLARFELEELRRREPHMLSGGQKQRTALAGVIAVPRRVLVLDEPTSMLDPAGRDEVLVAERELRGEGLAIVYITQEMDEAVGADRLVHLLSDVDDGEALVAQLAHRGEHLVAAGRVEHRRGLVEHQDAARYGDDAGQRRALFLAAREHVRLAPAQLLELEPRQHLIDPAADVRGRPRQVLEAEGDVVFDALRHELVLGVLEQHAHVAARRHAPALDQQVVTAGQRAARGGGLLQPAEQTRERGPAPPRSGSAGRRCRRAAPSRLGWSSYPAKLTASTQGSLARFVADIALLSSPVSYTHLTLPTNREV